MSPCPRDVAIIEAEYLQELYLAEMLKAARLDGVVPVPLLDPLGLRLLRRLEPGLVEALGAVPWRDEAP